MQHAPIATASAAALADTFSWQRQEPMSISQQQVAEMPEGKGQSQNEDAGQGQMLLVEAAALGAASPGAVVRVPTSTVLSQADQIALRYQHQASFQPEVCLSEA